MPCATSMRARDPPCQPAWSASTSRQSAHCPPCPRQCLRCLLRDETERPCKEERDTRRKSDVTPPFEALACSYRGVFDTLRTPWQQYGNRQSRQSVQISNHQGEDSPRSTSNQQSKIKQANHRQGKVRTVRNKPLFTQSKLKRNPQVGNQQEMANPCLTNIHPLLLRMHCNSQDKKAACIMVRKRGHTPRAPNSTTSRSPAALKGFNIYKGYHNAS